MKQQLKVSLSKREMSVLELVAEGHTSEKIARLLSISKSTVQTHRRNMLYKTGFTNTHQLVGWGYKTGLLKWE